MKILFRPITKKEASKIVLLIARILKVLFLIAAIGSALSVVLVMTSEMGIGGFILGLLIGALTFFVIMLSSLLTEAILVGISVVFENHYNSLDDKEEKTVKELFAETVNEETESFE